METPVRKKVRLGDLLLEKELINNDQLLQALAEQKKTGKKLGRAITDLGFVREHDLLTALADFLHYPYIDLSRYRINQKLVLRLPESHARRYRALVLSEEQGGLLVAMSDPLDLMAIDDLQRILKTKILPAFIRDQELLSILDTVYRRQEEMASIAGELEGELQSSDFDIDEMALSSDINEAPVVRLLQSLFEDAVQMKASDVHIEPEENQLRIRLRVDGELQEQIMKERRVASALVSRLKIMSGLDISEKRLPQDGRFNIRVLHRSIDVRLSTMPVQFGESVVMRLLDQTTGILELSSLGMPASIQKRFEYLIHRPHGLVLVTGPTGSGKTTTLYAALSQLNQPEKKIITAEDPIEYRLPRINQVQVNTKVGLEFSTVLRAALRQDPDIILIGEMRDKETAEIGLRAAMTGHMVLSTLHTNDAVSTVARLLDMEGDPYLVASSLRAVVAQRLVKKLCQHCRLPYQPDARETTWLKTLATDKSSASFYAANGCHHCHNTGYQGRVGIYELLELSPELIAALRHNDQKLFAEMAVKQTGFRSLSLCALDYAVAGITSLDEVLRVSVMLEEETV